MKIIAGIPARNNKKCIGSLVIGVKEQVDEVIVVDDGSTDNTLELAELSGATVIKQGNAGEGVAIRRLIEEAKNRGADILVLIEANCEYDPGDIPKVLAPILNTDADLVMGSRFIGDNAKRNKKKMLLARLFWAKVLNFVVNYGATVKVSDSRSGLRALSRYAIDMISLEDDGDFVKSEMVVEAVKQMIRLKEVGIGIWGDGKTSGGYD